MGGGRRRHEPAMEPAAMGEEAAVSAFPLGKNGAASEALPVSCGGRAHPCAAEICGWAAALVAWLARGWP